MSATARRSRAQRRQQLATRAGACRKAAIARGLRHATPLIDAIAEYAEISDNLPYPSQETLAKDVGVSVRTIKRWLAALKAIGVIQVKASPARHQGNGQWTRQTNRYILCDRTAKRQAPCTPLPRRRTGTNPAGSVSTTPRGHQRPLTLLGLEPARGGHQSPPPPKPVSLVVGDIRNRNPHDLPQAHLEPAPPLPKPNFRKLLAAAKHALDEHKPTHN